MYNLKAHIIWLIITYGMVLFAMFVDLITGIHKAKKNGELCTSAGLKKTCDKAAKYFLPMLALSCMDMIGSVVIPVPAFTMLYGCFNIICEVVSIFENTHTKQEIKNATNRIQVELKNSDGIPLDPKNLVEKIAEVVVTKLKEKSEE